MPDPNSEQISARHEFRLPAAHLKHSVRRGAGATAAAQLLGQTIQIGVLAILYRLLSVEDFGLFWMVVPVVLVLRIFSTLGLNVGAVQQAELGPDQMNVLFWLTIAAGLLTSLGTAALAPAVAWWNATPAVALLTVAMAGTTFLVACGAQHQALVERRLRLTELAAARIVAQLIAGVAAIVVATRGFGVWSLVVQWYLETGLLAAFCWWLEPWRPQAECRLYTARGLIQFGGYYTAASLFFALAQNLDKILLGRLAGAEVLGFYSQAFNWMMKPVLLLTTPLASVMLPALARSTHDSNLYRDVLFGFTRLIGILLIPAGIGLAIVAPEAMVTIGGAKWLAAGQMLRAMALAVTVQGFINAMGSILASVGRADRLLRLSIAMTVVLAIAYPLGYLVGQRFGAPGVGVAAAYAIAVLAMFVPYMAFGLSSTGVSAREWFRLLAPIAGPALAMGVVVFAFRTIILTYFAIAPPVLLLIEIAAGVATYALLARNPMRWFLGQIGRIGGGETT